MAVESPKANMDVDPILENPDNDSTSSVHSDESNGSSESDQMKENKIKELEEQMLGNPYHYDSHVELISLLRRAGELDKLRSARETMSKHFPLSSDLWIDWLTDEVKLVTGKEERKKVEQLFDRAVKDYSSVPVWIEYAQFSIGGMESDQGPENVRTVFENALTGAGLHVTEASMLWDTYREFEMALYQPLKEKEGEESDQQKSRVLSLFKRQLSVPLFDMEKTYSELEEWSQAPVDVTIKNIYQKALKKLKVILPFEEKLLSAETPRLTEYLSYLEFELKEGEPTRIQCLFERALVDNCLQPDIWQRYTRYLDSKLKIDDVSLPVHERAVRNCPWSGDLWVNYITAMERYGQGQEKVKGVIDAAFQSGVSSANDFRRLWLSYIHYLRRNIDWQNSSEKEVEQLRAVFQKAISHLQDSFALTGDPDCTILQYWAKVEAKFCKNLPEARELWNQILSSGHTTTARMWMEYANLERAFGDSKHYRKVLIRGLMSTRDWPETLGDALITFEREEGTLETFDVATEKYETQMALVLEKRKKEAEREERQFEVQAANIAKKRKFTSAREVDDEGFKIPQSNQRTNFSGPPRKKSKSSTPAKGANSSRLGTPKEARKGPMSDDNSQQEASAKVAAGVTHDPEKDMYTVFLSNLDYNVNEDQIRDIFISVGEIESLRLVRDYKGRSKGYCYLQYKSQESVQEALKKDRQPIQGRPIFCSPCMDKSKKTNTEENTKLKYSTGLEKNKLFIRGLPVSKTEDDVRKVFEEYGKLKQVRIVTYRNGHSKGIAYVDFEDEASATNALLKTDGLRLGGENMAPLRVAYSNPPTRKPRGGEAGDAASFQKALGGPSREATQQGSRGRSQASQMAFVPRSLNKTLSTPTLLPQQNGSPATAPKMSNADFRNLLLKK